VQIGVTVISEPEMMEFIENGAFPDNQTPTRPTHIPDFKTDEITWEERFAPETASSNTATTKNR